MITITNPERLKFQVYLSGRPIGYLNAKRVAALSKATENLFDRNVVTSPQVHQALIDSMLTMVIKDTAEDLKLSSVETAQLDDAVRDLTMDLFISETVLNEIEQRRRIVA